jgi:hypothetical protein
MNCNCHAYRALTYHAPHTNIHTQINEKGLFAWKRQQMDLRAVGDYSTLQTPLPDPPKGYEWSKDPTCNEWKVVPKDKNSTIEDKQEGGLLGLYNDVQRDDDTDVTSDTALVTHVVQPTDTLQGICLKVRERTRTLNSLVSIGNRSNHSLPAYQYRIKPEKLRQMNRFSGSNLALAPNKLIIPAATGKAIKKQEMTPEQGRESKIRCFLITFKQGREYSFDRSEAVAYLEMNDYNLDKAIQDAKSDCEWEHSS